jgi:hypothetical protein
MEENKYKLAIVPDYKKTVARIIVLVLLLLVPFIFFTTALNMDWINLNSISVKISVPLYILFVISATLFLALKSCTIDMITLKEDAIESERFGEIKYRQIERYQRFDRAIFPYCLLSFRNGKKWSLAPFKKKSAEAQKSFQAFVKDFEEKVNLTNRR